MFRRHVVVQGTHTLAPAGRPQRTIDVDERLLVAEVSKPVVLCVGAAKGEHLLCDDLAVAVQVDRHVRLVQVVRREQHEEPVAPQAPG
jgi:hypothetical protein